ncbi:MAG TPA: hypothetical protein VMF08_13385 [Candidatus Sulfotelmatobacter sp.]|nr:hypothetical protein [Candidatus Sulfotelmatobacter sp.]
MDKVELKLCFPGLAGCRFEITSARTRFYNCIAWAAGETHRRWWPDKMNVDYWPEGVPREATLEAFIAAYATLGYEACDNGNYESGFEKIVIFTKPAGTPTHAARQLPGGNWTSKLGDEEDIEHELRGIECLRYGYARQFMKRPTNPGQ